MANGSSSSVRRDLHRFFRRKIEIEKSRRIYQKPMPSSPLIIAVSLALVGSHRAPPPPACAFPPLFAKSGSGQLAPPSAPITQQSSAKYADALRQWRTNCTTALKYTRLLQPLRCWPKLADTAVHRAAPLILLILC